MVSSSSIRPSGGYTFTVTWKISPSCRNRRSPRSRRNSVFFSTSSLRLRRSYSDQRTAFTLRLPAEVIAEDVSYLEAAKKSERIKKAKRKTHSWLALSEEEVEEDLLLLLSSGSGIEARPKTMNNKKQRRKVVDNLVPCMDFHLITADSYRLSR
ncbi:hypothetical protein LINPERPRIM_LOCUS4114 [Linum perenne]